MHIKVKWAWKITRLGTFKISIIGIIGILIGAYFRPYYKWVGSSLSSGEMCPGIKGGSITFEKRVKSCYTHSLFGRDSFVGFCSIDSLDSQVAPLELTSKCACWRNCCLSSLPACIRDFTPYTMNDNDNKLCLPKIFTLKLCNIILVKKEHICTVTYF